LLSVCLFIACASPAFAISIKIWEVTDENTANINNWIGSQDGSVHVLEDFENIDTGWYSEKETGVGTFIADGKIGNGATSYNKDKNTDEYSIYPYFSIQESDTSWYGRSNTTESEGASQWLDSGDITALTLTIEDNSLKNLFFYIQDPADSGASTILVVNEDFVNFESFNQNQDKASFFVGITLEEDDKGPISSLTWLTTTQSDGFGLDDFSTIHNPEPATMLLFGFGLIGIAGITRKLT
jgi:hypothetical protein